MNKEQIKTIARNRGMWNSDLFESFIEKRFSNESDPSYISEWVDRFLSGNPVCYMDSKSKEVFKSLIE